MHKINFELEFSKYYLDMNTTHLDELLILSDLFNLWNMDNVAESFFFWNQVSLA
jgi:hypothetical protein